mmetsp:Transcript_28301/g.68823  ORF Transcript_28301/g.68823 Transcript_28301/m.68823 type:complete len:479 (+) Transcript_28301:292-1728(+)
MKVEGSAARSAGWGVVVDLAVRMEGVEEAGRKEAKRAAYAAAMVNLAAAATEAQEARLAARAAREVAAAAAAGVSVSSSPTALAEGQENLVMSGDCGGTNTRLILFRVKPGYKAVKGTVPEGKVVFEKKYQNAQYKSFTEVCQLFLKEAAAAGGGAPSVCCLACAGGIKDNTVSFTNVKEGWIIDGKHLSKTLAIPRVELINDFVAQGYGLLTLQPHEVIKINDATPKPGAPIACVGAGTGLGECFLTSSNGEYTCFPSEGGHAEFSPRSEITTELLHFMRKKLTEFGTPEKIVRVFSKWDTNHDGTIDIKEFTKAVSDLDLRGLRPKRISIERIVSGPGIADIYDFLRLHWAYGPLVDAEYDAKYVQAEHFNRSAIVAKCAGEGKLVCKKAIDIFNECYGSEVGVAALKWLPYGGLYISGGIAAKNPSWIKSDEFLHAYADKGRMSVLVNSVPLFLVLTEDTGERGALFYAVQMLSS